MRVLAILSLLGGVTWMLAGAALIESAASGPQALQGLFAAFFGLALTVLGSALLVKAMA